MKENSSLLCTKTLMDENATLALAATLARLCHKGDCVLLKGELGTGKTTFARGFIRALGNEEEVVSPTFTLAQTYTTSEGWPVLHCDLYRIKNPHEIEQLGLEDAVGNGVTLIEWPEVAMDALPPEALTVQLAYQGDHGRRALLSGSSDIWKSRIEALS
jgi:tRNA threonylcarbamoyl adenosine modification protein YjeE